MSRERTPSAEEHTAELWTAIRAITDEARTRPGVRAAFVAGSLVRGEHDAYSDADLYLVVHEREGGELLRRPHSLLESYGPVLATVRFTERSGIAAFFRSGIRVDLHVVTARGIRPTDAVTVLHDPEGLLASYDATPPTLSPTELYGMFDSCCLTLYDADVAVRRGDRLQATFLLSRLLALVTVLQRAGTRPENSMLGVKKLSRHLAPDAQRSFEEALDQLRPSTLREGAVRSVALLEEAVERLGPAFSEGVNREFLRLLRERASSWEG